MTSPLSARRRRIAVAASLTAVLALAPAVGLAPAPTAAALDGTPMTLTFQATAGQLGYLNFGDGFYDGTETVDVIVDWGDSTPTEAITSVGVPTHTYAADGTYVVTVSPRLAADGGSDTGPWLTLFGRGTTYDGPIELQDLTGTGVGTSTQLARLVAVGSFGDLGITSLRNAFSRHNHLTDLPTSIPSSVTDLSYTFAAAEVTDPHIGSWDVGAVTGMQGTFFQASGFDLPIGTWDVSSVTTMQSMFQEALAFDQDLSAWTPTSVTSMERTFKDAQAFNGNIATWKDRVRNVTTFLKFLDGASSFDQDLPDWDVSGADNLDGFFEDATSFNGSVAGWTFSSTVGIDVSNMFEGATSFDQPLSSWTTTSFDDINDIFKDATSFDQDISGWDVSNVTNFNDTFEDATSFDQDISAWDVSSGTNLTSMFNGASSFDRSLGDWTLNASADLNSMFSGSGMSSSCYDATLVGWAARSPAVTGRTLDASGVNYSPTGEAARTTLTGDRGWTISDAGRVDTATGRCLEGDVAPASAAPAGPQLACLPVAPAVGATVTCTVSGGDPDVEILWEAGASAPFASRAVRLGPDGVGTFTFTVPAAALGRTIGVQLVAWGVDAALPVSAPVPTAVRAGEGSGGRPPLPAGAWVALAALGLAGASGARLVHLTRP